MLNLPFQKCSTIAKILHAFQTNQQDQLAPPAKAAGANPSPATLAPSTASVPAATSSNLSSDASSSTVDSAATSTTTVVENPSVSKPVSMCGKP